MGIIKYIQQNLVKMIREVYAEKEKTIVLNKMNYIIYTLTKSWMKLHIGWWLLQRLKRVLYLCHNKSGAHLGVNKTVNKISSKYYFPSITETEQLIYQITHIYYLLTTCELKAQFVNFIVMNLMYLNEMNF